MNADIDLFLLRVYDLFLTTGIDGFGAEDDGPDGEPPPNDPVVENAIKADRFKLMIEVRRLRNQAQGELSLGSGA